MRLLGFCSDGPWPPVCTAFKSVCRFTAAQYGGSAAKTQGDEDDEYVGGDDDDEREYCTDNQDHD